jgi:hypothetical protein
LLGLIVTSGAPASASATDGVSVGDAIEAGGAHCTATTEAQQDACRYQALADMNVSRARCFNVSDAEERDACFEQARAERVGANKLCREQREARLEICDALGEARYAPDFDPADFESDYHHLVHPHPYFPLTIGHRWDYDGSLETNTIVALDETKLIDGVTCIVLNDKRYENGLLVEDTDDWYGQRKDGTVDFCGEAVSNFETFPGDSPSRPERLNTDGQWKTGREGDPSGAYILASPRVGDIHRSEFSPGKAEDTVRYLSLAYGYGGDAELDEHVPRALADLLCNHDCWVTGEITGLEPGSFTRKYYARGIGFFLGVEVDTGEKVQLTSCNFDPRCVSLPRP